MERKIILYSTKSPGPTNYFDPETYIFLENNLVQELLERGEVKLKLTDIPYIILIDIVNQIYYNTVTGRVISEDEAKKLTNSGTIKAELRVQSSPLDGTSRDNTEEENKAALDAAQKKPILYSKQSPGPTHFFDLETYTYLDVKVVHDLVDRDLYKIKECDIPYIILTDEKRTIFLNTTTQSFISESEAKELCDGRGAEIISKISVTAEMQESKGGASNLEESKGTSSNDSRKSGIIDTKAKVLISATAAGGTAAAAAGAASVPFLAGFTSGGVAAGSIAAGIQSAIGSVAAGSGFAALQSIAATTLIGTALPVAVAGAAVAGTAAAGVMLHKHIKKKKRKRDKNNGSTSKSNSNVDFVEIVKSPSKQENMRISQNEEELFPSYDNRETEELGIMRSVGNIQVEPPPSYNDEDMQQDSIDPPSYDSHDPSEFVSNHSIESHQPSDFVSYHSFESQQQSKTI